MAVTVQTLQERKANQEKFSCLTAYDATFASLLSECGIDVILVGDSLGMVLQGKDSTLPVSMDDMVYHTESVARGRPQSLIMADMPFMSYATNETSMANAARLMQAGAHMVKLEGTDWMADTIHRLSERGIPVCAHLGLTPQFVNKLGGYRVQGVTARRRIAWSPTHGCWLMPVPTWCCLNACRRPWRSASPGKCPCPSSALAQARIPMDRSWSCTTCSASPRVTVRVS